MPIDLSSLFFVMVNHSAFERTNWTTEDTEEASTASSPLLTTNSYLRHANCIVQWLEADRGAENKAQNKKDKKHCQHTLDRLVPRQEQPSCLETPSTSLQVEEPSTLA